MGYGSYSQQIYSSHIDSALVEEREAPIKIPSSPTKPANAGHVETSAENISGITATVVTGQGERPHQQDKHLIVKIKNSTLQNLSEEAMIQALEKTAAQLSHHLKKNPNAHLAGSTATVCVLFQNKIFTLQVGDSLAVKANFTTGKFNRLNRLHHPHYASEKGRIYWGKKDVETKDVETKEHPSTPTKTIGQIGKTGTGTRIVYTPDLSDSDKSHTLALSRTFGDHFFANTGVNSEPDIYVRDIENDEDFLLVYTDGLREVMTDQAIVTFLQNQSHLNAAGQLEALRAEAYRLGCHDNTKIILLPIKKDMQDADEAIIVGVFDGHDLLDMDQKIQPNNGAAIAQYLADNFTKVLQQNIEPIFRARLLPELQDAIDLAQVKNLNTLALKLQTLQKTLIDNILEDDPKTQSLPWSHPSRKIGEETLTMLHKIYAKTEYVDKISAVQQYRAKALNLSLWQKYGPSRAVIYAIIGAIVGLAIGVIIGGLITGGLGSLPGGIAGGISGFKAGLIEGACAAGGCYLMYKGTKKGHSAYSRRYVAPSVTTETAAEQVVDELIVRHKRVRQ